MPLWNRRQAEDRIPVSPSFFRIHPTRCSAKSDYLFKDLPRKGLLVCFQEQRGKYGALQPMRAQKGLQCKCKDWRENRNQNQGHCLGSDIKERLLAASWRKWLHVGRGMWHKQEIFG